MPHLLLKDLPRYECLLECAQHFPALNPSACEVFLHLLRTGDEAFRVADAYFQARGVSQGRFTVLMLLYDKTCGQTHTFTPAQLAEQAGVTRATMNGLIDTLERDGMVTRKPDPSDRRGGLVRLTAEGRDRADQDRRRAESLDLQTHPREVGRSTLQPVAIGFLELHHFRHQQCLTCHLAAFASRPHAF